jgi:segregation and condensation protein A
MTDETSTLVAPPQNGVVANGVSTNGVNANGVVTNGVEPFEYSQDGVSPENGGAPENGVAPENGEASDGPREFVVRDPDRFVGYKVQLRVFEGPLDLLLYLIRAHRLDVCDVSIAEVTNQFIEFLTLMDEIELDYAGEFLVTAATLMQIKARMLLPKHQSENEDELNEEKGKDPRKELVQRLLEYQQYQEAANALKEMREERAQMWTRPKLSPELAEALAERMDEAKKAEDDGALLLQDVSTFDLLRALQKVLDRVQERPVATIRREPFTLAERVKGVFAKIKDSIEGATFGALCEDCQTRLEVVITFLSVLELISRKRIVVIQDQLFDEILVKVKVGDGV